MSQTFGSTINILQPALQTNRRYGQRCGQQTRNFDKPLEWVKFMGKLGAKLEGAWNCQWESVQCHCRVFHATNSVHPTLHAQQYGSCGASIGPPIMRHWNGQRNGAMRREVSHTLMGGLLIGLVGTLAWRKPAGVTSHRYGAQSFIENLFPEQCMPKGSNNIPWKNAENHLRDEGIFSPDKLAWRDCPNLDAFTHHLEGQFGGFINAVAEICGEALGSGAPRRRWMAKYSTNVLGGHQANRKLDLTLIDQNTSTYEFMLKYDCGGLMRSAAISITHPTGWTCFARMAYCLAYCHPHWLGYNISAQLAPCHGPRLMAMQYSLFGRRSNVHWVHHLETKESFIVKDTWHNVISPFQSRAGLEKALRDCVIAHREVFQTFKVLHRDIHIGNLYIKTETGNDGGELGDWGFAECQDLCIVQQCLQPLNCTFPKKAEPIIPASSPMSAASSLTSMPSSPEPFQLRNLKTLRPQQPRVLAQAPSWQTLTTDNESDPDARRTSTSDPWDQFGSWAGAANSNIDLVEQTGNTARISVCLMYTAAIEQFCPHKASKQKSAEELEETMLVDHWWNQQHWRSSAEWKVTTMKQDALWKSRIASHIGPYFDCFKPVVDKMRKALFHHITYEEMIGFLSEMVKIAEQEEEHSDRGTPAITEVASSSPWEESHASFFSLLESEVGDDIDSRSIPEDKLALRPTDAASYTPTKVFKISLVLNAVAATSELPEGDVQPEPINEPPSRVVIKKSSRAHPPATISTGNLPTEEGTVTDPVANHTSNAVAGSSKCKAPKDVDNNARKKFRASEKNSLANEGGKKSHRGKKSITSNRVKKSRTSDGGKKKSIVVGVAGKKSGTSCSHCNDDEDYVPGKASTSGKRKN
ncbi:uncharacterized protein EDB91DRAFT_1080338 [Suillus paluster]|uniref:uncharacterized protein n=1 Tax=Suillus paluster TaxID=48578 RepID=UPI001B85D518|nr:uncharacterized protein EDB91DRAFT_1080338 [Suillus paluster]KAG1745418.1 hypothetical protein EDB91DRAFT_1080338 [Suillus paluster]